MELSGCQSSEITRQFKFVWNRKFQAYGEFGCNRRFEFMGMEWENELV